jgi:FixJ family two-component response regulator
VWQQRADIPIIFASGHAETEAIEVIAGKDAIVLRKPFRTEELQEVIVRQLGRRSLATRPATALGELRLKI